ATRGRAPTGAARGRRPAAPARARAARADRARGDGGGAADRRRIPGPRPAPARAAGALRRAGGVDVLGRGGAPVRGPDQGSSRGGGTAARTRARAGRG